MVKKAAKRGPDRAPASENAEREKGEETRGVAQGGGERKIGTYRKLGNLYKPDK